MRGKEPNPYSDKLIFEDTTDLLTGAVKNNLIVGLTDIPVNSSDPGTPSAIEPLKVKGPGGIEVSEFFLHDIENDITHKKIKSLIKKIFKGNILKIKEGQQ